MSHRQSLLAAAGLVVLSGTVGYYAHTARAGGIPSTNTLTYSGTLQDESGAPLKGRQAIDFRLFDAREKGQERCVLLNPRDGYPLTADGRFSIVLPDACVTAVSEHPKLWVEVRVAGSELARAPLGAVPYAVEARRAATADNASGALEQRIAALEAQVSGKVAGIWFASNAPQGLCASIINAGWTDVPDTTVTFSVDKPVRIWSSYAINVQPMAGPADGYLATRIVIDEQVAEASANHYQPFTNAHSNDTISGSFASDLEPGEHAIKMQWATGGADPQALATTWENCPVWAVTGGSVASRSVSVIGVYR